MFIFHPSDENCQNFSFLPDRFKKSLVDERSIEISSIKTVKFRYDEAQGKKYER
jgi:hypothetical protein